MPSYPTSISAHFDAPRAAFDDLVDELMNDSTCQLDHVALEELVDSKGREVLRQLFQSHLYLRAAQEDRAEVVGADGEARTHK